MVADFGLARVFQPLGRRRNAGGEGDKSPIFPAQAVKKRSDPLYTVAIMVGSRELPGNNSYTTSTDQHMLQCTSDIIINIIT